jgi:hypothetical protein
MRTAMQAITETLKTKLQSLLTYLSEVTEAFEAIAEDVECANLKTAIFTLSVESKQYAEEISDQMQEFNLTLSLTGADKLWKKIESNIHEQAEMTHGGEIIALCNNCENYFKKFYEDVLHEYIPTKSFKDLITYQLFAMQCAFMKIRLLNRLRFSNEQPLFL